MKAFNGRVNRATYWVMLAFIVGTIAILSFAIKSRFQLQEWMLAFVYIPRLHDIGKSGWYLLIGLAVELIGVVASLSLLTGDDVSAGLGFTVLVVACLIIWLGAIRGEADSNRFGPPPPSGVTWGKRPQA